jgi:hypothetical protein
MPACHSGGLGSIVGQSTWDLRGTGFSPYTSALLCQCHSASALCSFSTALIGARVRRRGSRNKAVPFRISGRGESVGRERTSSLFSGPQTVRAEIY